MPLVSSVLISSTLPPGPNNANGLSETKVQSAGQLFGVSLGSHISLPQTGLFPLVHPETSIIRIINSIRLYENLIIYLIVTYV